MSWAQRLTRVFNIDIEVCDRCGGSVKVIACIEDQNVIDRILIHLRQKKRDIPILPSLKPPPGHDLRRYRFSLKRNPVQQHTISKEATENVWLDSVRSTIQQWTDVNCSMTEADKMPQSSTGYPRPFQALWLVPIRRPAHDSPFICPILHLQNTK